MSRAEPLSIEYAFQWPQGRRVVIPIALDASTLEAEQALDPEACGADWVRLEANQCPNCPLSAQTHASCPVAMHVAPLLTQFADATSFEEVDVSVTTECRTYSAHTSLQQGVSSMLGVVMATSGCPILDPMRPMARFHLPFASYDETAYRALSMYLVAQHLRAQNGEPADWALDGLVAMYEAIQLVNAAFAQRLKRFITNDANANALVILDCFAVMTSMDVAFRRRIPESLEPMFAALVQRSA